MLNFVYHSPTKVIFGKDTESFVGNEIAQLGFKKVLVHFGSASAKRSGLIDRVHASLDKAGIKHIDLGGVKPNPRLDLAREGIELGRKEGVDFILAVGGGSVIDSAKCIAYGLANPGDVWDLFAGKATAKACAPVGCVLTIAAAGSETSNSCVISKIDADGVMHKRAYNDDISRPRFAIMNPLLTASLPEYQTMCGVVDILMHTMERYFTTAHDGELIDRMSEGLLVTVLENGRRLKENPDSYDARAEIMWAGSLSHNGLTGTGRTGDFASHIMEHELSAMWDVAHGAGLAALWGSWARHVLDTDVTRFTRFAVKVMGVEMNFHNLRESALRGIEALEEYFTCIGMPISIAGLGVGNVTDAQIDEMVRKCSFDGTRTIGNFKKLDCRDMKKIYQMAK